MPSGKAISAKVSHEEAARIQAMADQMNMTTSQLLKAAVKMYGMVDPEVTNIIDVYTKSTGLSPSLFISMVILDFAARMDAYREVYRHVRDVNNPFTFDDEFNGDKVFKFLRERYIREFVEDNREAERQYQELKRDRERLREKYEGKEQ